MTSGKNKLILIFILSLQMTCFAALNMRGLTSYLRASPGAHLVVNQPINNFSGKLIRDQGGIISGNPITFAHGLFEDSGNDLLLNAIFDLDLTGSEIHLAGASSNLLRAQPGVVYQNVFISGQGNRIEGSPIMTQNIVLNDAATTVTMAMQTSINSNIRLNDGTVALDADLTFADNKLFVGSGVVNANNHKIIFGGKPLSFVDNLILNNASDIQLWSTLNLSAVDTFNGISTLNGNGNIIQFEPGGQILIGSGAILNLTDVVLKNFGNNSIAFTDSAGQIIMSNVTIDLAENITTTIGNFYVSGPATVVVKGYWWNFDLQSSLTVDGVTLWSDVAGSMLPGFITYGASNLSLLNTGTIKSMDGTIIYCDYLQAEITNLQLTCSALTTSVAALESATSSLDTRVTDLELCCTAATATIAALELCCQSISTSIENLQTCGQCQFITTVSTQNSYFDLSMIPVGGNVIIFRFAPASAGGSARNRFIFDPAHYGNGGVVPLPMNFRMVFDGDGIVELKDGVIFTMNGTPGDPLYTDWAAIVTQNLATMQLDQNATVSINGVGCFVVRSHGTLLVDQPNSKIIFGGNFANDEIAFMANFDSNITINDPTAFMSFYNGIFDIIFDNHSTLHIVQGSVEFNMLNGIVPGGLSGYIRKWHMINGSELDIQKNGTTAAVLSIAPNRNNQLVDFDNHSGFISAGGDFEYKLFDATGTRLLVDTVCQIQARNITALTDPMSDIFRELSYVLDPQIVKSPDATILCVMGSKLNSEHDGSLGAFLPKQSFPNGKAIYLQQGDHDICYDKSSPNGPLNLIRGVDRSGVWFRIANGIEATRYYPR